MERPSVEAEKRGRKVGSKWCRQLRGGSPSPKPDAETGGKARRISVLSGAGIEKQWLRSGTVPLFWWKDFADRMLAPSALQPTLAYVHKARCLQRWTLLV